MRLKQVLSLLLSNLFCFNFYFGQIATLHEKCYYMILIWESIIERVKAIFMQPEYFSCKETINTFISLACR